MKKMIIMFTFIIMITNIRITAKAEEYTKVCKYIGHYTFVDSEGEAWKTDGTEDIKYSKKAKYLITFNDNNTATIFDDNIVSIKKVNR